MKKMGMLAVLVLASATGWAQKSFDDEVNSELDSMYQQRHETQIQAQNLPQSSVQVNVQSAVQKQPTTVIEASPLTESRVEKMRRARQDSELQTEQKIVEKLEMSRIEDEKKRSEVLFGDRFNQLSGQPSAQPAPVVVAPPNPEIQVKSASNELPEEKLDREAIHEEVTAALEEQKLKDVSPKKTYISAMGGLGVYNNQNIQSEGAAGVGIGMKVNDHLMAEVQFNFSEYKVTLPYSLPTYNYGYTTYTPVTQDLKQYQGVAEIKYALFSGTLRPVLGVAGAYTYRSYTSNLSNLGNYGSSSNAMDAGPLAGVDMDLFDNFTLGFEARYMWNIYNQTQSNNGNNTLVTTGSSVTPESLGYFVMGLTGRLMF
jgi:hypothetical protein